MDSNYYDIWAGHKVRLRSVTPLDYDLFFANSRDSDAQRAGDELYLPVHPEALRASLEKAPNADEHKGRLAIETLDGSLVGSINVGNLSTQRFTYVQYGLSVFRDHWRKGYGSEAIKLLLRYYFKELRVHYAMASCWSFNEASIALHKHLGFREEGRYREIWYSNGEYHDELHFGMLDREFDELGLSETLPKAH